MRRMIILAAYALLAALLSGCAVKNIEAQAYAVSLGIDLTERGLIEVSVQVPSLGESGSEGGKTGGGGGYTFSSAQGETLTEALEMLNAMVPRELNLTGVKSIIVSEALARSDRFQDALEELALAYRVYGAAEVIVSDGKAADFIKEQQPVIGLRISESTSVALRHYQEYGYIPSAKAADLFYISRSYFGDPVAILASGSTNEEKSDDRGADSYAETLPAAGEQKNRYFGTALFSNGKMVGKLNGKQTQLLNLLLGNIEYFSWVVEGVPVRINISGKPEISVDLSGENPVIDIKLTLNMMESEGKLSPETLREELLHRLNEVTSYCQACCSDPMRLAEAAAVQFLTVEEWLMYDWKNRYPGARIRYEMEVKERHL